MMASPEYHMQIAHKRLAQAEENMLNVENDAAVGRLYYACLEAVKAVFSSLGTEGRISHRGASVLFHKEVVQKGVMDVKWGAFFSKLQRDRTLADYPEPDKEALIPDARTVHPIAMDFVEIIRELFVPSVNPFVSTLGDKTRDEQ